MTGRSGLCRQRLPRSAPERAYLPDLASNKEIDPGLWMVPKGSQPVVMQTETLADVRCAHAAEAFPAYRRERSG
jgi:hypothetical protein